MCLNYTHQQELDIKRITLWVYLIDWKYCLTFGRQLTTIKWFYGEYGPAANDDEIENLLYRDSIFTVDTLGAHPRYQRVSITGERKDVKLQLEVQETDIIDFVIKVVEPKYWNDLMWLIYTTYPFKTKEKYMNLDLVSLAKEYQLELK